MKSKLKVMEYNILQGFHTKSNPAMLEHERLVAARKLVLSEEPDILVLIEACADNISKHGINIDYSKEFNLPHHFHGHKPNGSHHGISILSKYPFIEKEDYSIKDMQFVRISVKLNNKLVRIDALHPHPDLNDKQKARFFKGVIRDSTENTILIGDFNSLSRTDKHDRENLIKKVKSFPQFKDKEEKIVEEVVDDHLTFEAMDIIEKSNFMDTYRQIHKKGINGFTIPTNLSDKDKSAASRIDFIFVSKNINIIDANIIKNNLAEIASDHYPIYAVLEI